MNSHIKNGIGEYGLNLELKQILQRPNTFQFFSKTALAMLRRLHIDCFALRDSCALSQILGWIV